MGLTTFVAWYSACTLDWVRVSNADEAYIGHQAVAPKRSVSMQTMVPRVPTPQASRTVNQATLHSACKKFTMHYCIEHFGSNIA